MMGYVSDIVMNLGITFLIILGGLGFTVIIDLNRYFFFKEGVRRLSLHTKLVLMTTGVLLVLGVAAFFLTEYHGTMEGFTIAKRLLASWFQSATTRTAGFNSIDISGLSGASILITLALMFIGASPGSTGGGIKTTTFAVLALSITSLLKGKRDLSIFNRRIPSAGIREATSLITLSAALIFFVLFVLLMVEPFPFEKLFFEAVSAFGTVGLSTGITPLLSETGKLLITLLMYVGRIGPLTMIYAFAIKRNVVNLDYAEEKIAIG
jgi:trk system potassium uptake protein TrkH